MSKLTKSYKSNFTTVPNSIINDKNISLKAKGIYLFLISKPDNWTFSVDRIASQNSDGENSVRTGLKELEEHRYLKRVQINKRGVFGENDYIIYDEPYPSDENHRTVKKEPSDDSRRTVSRRTENRPTLVKTDLVKEEEEKREDNFNPPSPALDAVICSDISDYPYLDLFLDFMTRKAKNEIVYRSILRENLLNDNTPNHNRTFLNYQEFVRTLSINSIPSTVSAFDIYENMGVSNVPN
jgi:hypothetical protein